MLRDTYIPFEYYLTGIKNLGNIYNDIYVASDTLNHELIKGLQKLYPKFILVDKDQTKTIQFGSTCKHIILSGGSYSAIIGYIAFYSNIYCSNRYGPWRVKVGDPGMFSGKSWNIILPEKDIMIENCLVALFIGSFPKPFNSTTDAIGGSERTFLHSMNLLTKNGYKVFVELPPPSPAHENIPGYFKKAEAEVDPNNPNIIYIHNYEMLNDLPHLHRFLLNKDNHIDDVSLVYCCRIEESYYDKIKSYKNIYHTAKFINHLEDFCPGFGFTPLFDKVIVPSKTYFNVCIEKDDSNKLNNQLIYIPNPLDIDLEKIETIKNNVTKDKFKIVCTSGKIIKDIVEKIATKLYNIDKGFYIECYMPTWNDYQNGRDNIPNIYWGERDETNTDINSGKKNRDELFEIMTSSLCILYPSNTPETYGNVFPESQLCGIPTITNDVKNSTTREHLTDWQILENYNDVDGFVNKILQLHNNTVDLSQILHNKDNYKNQDKKYDEAILSII